MDSPRILVHSLYDFHTQLFPRVLEGMETVARELPSERNTHVAWIAGHLVSVRFILGDIIGLDIQEPFPNRFAFGRSMDVRFEYPPLAEQREAWKTISPRIRKRLFVLQEADWQQVLPVGFPLGNTRADFLTYFLHHEAYHLGQLGYLRKWWGKESIKHHL